MGAKTLLWGFVLLSLLACKVEKNWDTERISSDLSRLEYRLNKVDVSDPWNVLFLIEGLSEDTLSFLYANQNGEYADHFSSVIKTLEQKGLRLAQSGLRMLKPQSPLLPSIPRHYLEQIERQNKSWYEDLRQSNKIFTWEYLGPRERLPHYCSNECFCISLEYGKNLQTLDLVESAFRLTGVAKGGLRLKNYRDRIVYYSYHTATLIKNSRGEFGVFDPVLFGDTRLYSFDDWFQRFVDKEELELLISPIK